jgi:hypothetical protein
MLAGLLCLLLVGFAATSYGTVRWDVVGSPTEVINYGRSEVLGSVTMVVNPTGPNVTGTTGGGDAQIGFIFTNPAVQIDNTTASGIKVFTSGVQSVTIVSVTNQDINGRCSGFITLNIAAGQTLAAGSFIRLEGVRGRVDQSSAITPGTDLYVDLQSINDPAANLFTPDRVRVAKSLCPLFVTVNPDTLLLCFPASGKPNAGAFTASATGLPPYSSPNYSIVITEGFARAFVDATSNGNVNFARVDDFNQPLGAPTNNTQFMVWLQDIPASVKSIAWPATVPNNQQGTGPFTSSLVLTGTPAYDTTTGTASAIYTFTSSNQTNFSDITVETFTVQPALTLNTGATATGTVNAGVYLAPFASETLGSCTAPAATYTGITSVRPRFVQLLKAQPPKATLTCVPPADVVQPYASIIRCNCYLLFTYVTSTPGALGFNTGIAIANTTSDTGPFGTAGAPDQLGKITFYFYDKSAAFVGTVQTSADILPGKSFVELLSNILPTGVTSFSGYVIAKADFQYCHGFAFIADNAFANIAQGYLANVVPDPAIKAGVRTASAAADTVLMVPAGESLNN